MSPDAALVTAARDGEVEAVRRLLAAGEPVNPPAGEPSALWAACVSDAADADRIAVATVLLDAGASTRSEDAPPLHAAAERGPLALVELLIRRGAVEGIPDRTGRRPLDAARAGTAPDRDAIVELLDRPVLRDPAFRAAVAAIQAGDVAGVGRLLDAHPRLLHERAVEPACYRESGREQYFLDPNLLWFVALNPIPDVPVPATIVDVTRVLLARGPAKDDLDATLGLLISGAAAREAGRQLELMDALLAAGARATPDAIDVALAHQEREAVAALLRAGYPSTAPIAAGLGRTDELPALLAGATRQEANRALGLAVINDQPCAARLALDAGADVGAFLPVHVHSTALHQAALTNDVALIDLLLAHGAATDVRDRVWNGTPLDWAIHERREEARKRLAIA
jgi:ankyrin repeat protein